MNDASSGCANASIRLRGKGTSNITGVNLNLSKKIPAIGMMLFAIVLIAVTG